MNHADGSSRGHQDTEGLVQRWLFHTEGQSHSGSKYRNRWLHTCGDDDPRHIHAHDIEQLIAVECQSKKEKLWGVAPSRHAVRT